jgi:diguanylate cyclase (GGDEF)-like protein
VLVLAADFGTNPRLTFTLFYLAPIGIASWYLGWRAGLLMAIFGSLVWPLGDYLTNDDTTSAIRFWNGAVRSGVFLVIAYVIGMLRHVLDHERELARTDALTGVPNWRHFSELAARELSRARRYRRPISLAYIDVDNFKHVNDTLGHEAGNEVLREIAVALQSSLRLTDMVARVGGDEFVVLLPDQGSDGAATALAKVRRDLTALCERSHRHASIGFSIGVITALNAPAEIETLIHAADALMYGVKSEGKADCRFGLLEEQVQRN